MPADSPISVFLADDHPVFLDAITQAVADRPDLEVAGCASDGEDAAAAIAALRPDVALLDMRLPGLSGQDILNKAKDLGLSTRIVFLSAHVDSDVIYRALAAGAAGYLSKASDRADVCDAVAAAGRGEVVLSPEVQDGLARSIRDRDGNGAPGLTPRESAILALAAEGLSTREIATRLGVASATVKTHLHSVYHKLEARDRASAVAAALRRGLLA